MAQQKTVTKAKEKSATRTWKEIVPYGPQLKAADEMIDEIVRLNDFILYIGSFIAPPFRGRALMNITVEFDSEDSARSLDQVIKAIRNALQLPKKPDQNFETFQAEVSHAEQRFGNDMQGFARYCQELPA